MYLAQPLGSTMSGWLSGTIGRKKSMMLANIPHIFAWIMLFFATSISQVFLASILLGLGVGLMEAPTLTYVGEIT